MSTVNGSEITVPQANEYIERFIDNYHSTGKAPVKSMIIDADLLRSYLSNPDIQNVKFMLGAREIIHLGAPLEVFTLIVGGYNAAGDYILTPSGLVVDHFSPCPPNCPPVGDAGNDYIS